MAGNPDGSAELEQKLVSGVVFLLLGDAERGVLGNVVFDVDVAFELFKAGNIGVFWPKGTGDTASAWLPPQQYLY